jgi:hypothetical protein
MILGQGGEYHCVCAEQVPDEECGRHDPVLTWEEAGSEPPQDVWVHRVRLEHGAAPKEAGGL